MSYTHCFSFAQIKRAAVSVSASALLFMLALAAPFAAQAEWQPGLLGGNIIAASDIFHKIDMPTDMTPHLGPHAATNYVAMTYDTTEARSPVWAKYQTWVYVGEIYLDGSTYAFAESIDDGAYLVIDGQIVLDNGVHNVVTYGTIQRPAGWYSVEVRLYNGINNAGPNIGGGNLWDTLVFGLGYNKTGAINQGRPVWKHFTYPEDDGNFSLFRYDDGIGYANAVDVFGSPAGVSEPFPAFGANLGIEPNQVINAHVPAMWTNAAENVIAFPTGWEVYAREEDGSYSLTNSGSGASFTYTHLDVNGRIIWNFVVSNLISAAATPGGSVAGAGWCVSTNSLELTATAAPGYVFHGWAGDVPAGSIANPLTLAGDKPRIVRPIFTGDMHVSINGDDEDDGISFASAKKTIAAAVAAIPDGGTVVVSNGQYAVTSEILIEAPITVSGFTGVAEDVVVLRNTTGNPVTRIFNINHPDARIEFMTVSGGRLTSRNTQGSNIYIGANGGTVADCIVRNGDASQDHSQSGGNIAIDGALGLVTRSVISNGVCNAAGNGGGAGVRMNAGRVEHCFIAYNRDNTGTSGFAVQMNGNNPMTLENCTIVRNIGGSGGAVSTTHANSVVRNCVIVDNEAPNCTDASGSAFMLGQEARFVNCVADAFINNNNFTTSGGFGFADAAKHDYRLTPLALALDKGATSTSASTTDIDGNPRIVDVIDAGCYEYQGNGDGALDVAFDSGSALRHAVPFDVVFTAAVVNASGAVTFTWDFGDDTDPVIVTDVFSVTHTYETPGVFDVKVTVDDGSANAASERDAFVYAAPNLICVAIGAENPESPYDTFAKGFPTVAAALAVADNGTTIVISNGTHSISPQLDLVKDIELRGFSGNPNDTILRATGANRVLYINHSSVLVRDLTIENGRPAIHLVGGNVLIDPQGGTLTNCVIRGGHASSHNGKAGGVFMTGAAALVTHCVITNNTIESLGANNKGAGVQVEKGARLAHSLIVGNRSGTGDGNIAGGVYIADSGSCMINCTVVANTSRDFGGVYAAGGTVVNCVIAGNVSSERGKTNPDSHAWGGVASAFVNCTTDAYVNDTCKVADATKIFKDFAASNYQLSADSPAIDAGELVTPEEAALAGLDLAGNPRIINNRMDNGCFESRARSTILIIK